MDRYPKKRRLDVRKTEADMFDNYKKSLLHFETDGKNIMHDFVSSRLKKAAGMRRVIHACFYVQCVAAITSIIVGLVFAPEVFSKVFATMAGISVILVAFFALGGHSGEKTASYVLDMVYAVTSFFMGGIAMYFCGSLLLVAAVASLTEFIVGYFRDWLLGFPTMMIKREHYTYTGPVEAEEPEEELPPPEPQKSELQEVAEAFMDILK